MSGMGSRAGARIPNKLRDFGYRASINAFMLSLKAEVMIEELSAVNLVTRDTYDGSGNITGQKSEEEYQQELRDATGRVFFGLTITVGEKATRIHSALSSPPSECLPQREERAHMLADGFAAIGRSIYLNFSE